MIVEQTMFMKPQSEMTDREKKGYIVKTFI